MITSVLDPTIFFRGDGWALERPAIISTARSKFATFYETERRAGTSAYDLDRIGTAIFYLRTLLIRSGFTGRDKVAVEIGCGTGNKALSICDLFGQYVGVDILADQIENAKRRARTLGVDNLTAIAGNAVDLLASRPRQDIPAKIDLLILYAVVEHLTLAERSEIFSLADQVMDGGGAVLVMESPNRLIPYDSHTVEQHFANWLPDEMAYDFAARVGVARLPHGQPAASAAPSLFKDLDRPSNDKRPDGHP